jgi:hypothetical protein
MSKSDSISLKLSKETASYIRNILFEHQKGYSFEHCPDRIVQIRDVVSTLDKNLEN